MAQAAPVPAKRKQAPKGAGKPPAGVQRKLAVGGAGDHYEREADHVARKVMQGGAAGSIPPSITPIGAQCKKLTAPPARDEKAKPVATAQRKAVAPAKTPKNEDKKGSGKVQRKAAAPSATSKPKADAKTGTKSAKGAGGKAQRKVAAGGADNNKKQEPKPARSPAKGAQRKEAGAGSAAGGGGGGVGMGGGAAPASVEGSIARMQSTGGPGMDSSTRGFMENRFGRDFGNVRVHRSQQAAAAASALNARAFTVGNDVFFNHGQYQPHSSTGRELIAHELTHTVQQGATPPRAARRVQRVPDAAPPDVTLASGTELTSTRDPNRKILYQPDGGKQGTVTLPKLALPRVTPIPNLLKGIASTSADAPHAKHNSGNDANLPRVGQPYVLSELAERENAIPTWLRFMRRADKQTQIVTKLAAMATAKPTAAAVMSGTERVYYLKPQHGPASRDRIFVGTGPELARDEAILRPNWDNTGHAASFDVDHILELQIGGMDAGENMWLLDSGFNRSSGSTIHTDTERLISDLQSDRTLTDRLPNAARPAGPADIKAHWNIKFGTVEQHARLDGSSRPAWTAEQIATGVHLNQLELMTEPDLTAAGMSLNPAYATTEVVVFPNRLGGPMRRLPLDSTGNTVDVASIPRDPADGPGAYLYSGIEIISGSVTRGTYLEPGGQMVDLEVRLLPPGRRGQPPPINQVTGHISVLREPRLRAGYLSRDRIRRISSTFPGASPISFPDLDISANGKLAGEGDIAATKALFPGFDFKLFLDGNDIGIMAPIPTDRLSMGPLSVTEANLALGYGANGLFVGGFAAFEVRGLGSGTVEGRMDGESAYLAGNFSLLTDFLTPATVGVRYDLPDDRLTINAHLGVQSGKLPGIASADANITITRDGVNFAGTATLMAPLAGTVVNIGYAPETGLTVGAQNIALPVNDIPAIQNATLSVSATRSLENVWSLSGQGTANLALPGVTGTVTIGYLDGVVTFTTVATVQKGPATGTLNFTATNAAIDEEGHPVDGEVGSSITAWGRGSVSIQFGSIITGTAGIEYTQDHRVILRGEIALPPTYDVFARREYTRELLHLEPPEFPIWGVSVAGIGVGVFAFVDARIAFNAYVGPGQIRDASISAEMDLDRPEDALIHGHGQFFVPAYAGLSLDVGGGLRARAAVAYAQGRVGLTGELGLQADASASVDFDWNRNAGLSLETNFEANVRPKFRLSANASVTVGVDLLVTDVSHTFGPWQRVLGEFGPDMQLGVSFPMRWSEANGLDLSLDNMTVRQPSLDASALMSSVFDQLAG